MNVAPGRRVFLAGCLWFAASRADANLNRSVSSARELSPPAAYAAYGYEDPATAGQGPSARRSLGLAAGESPEPGSLPISNASDEGDAGDERYFGSATWSVASKPRMIDFSFGQASGPAKWWSVPELDVQTASCVAAVPAIPKMTFDWGNLRRAHTRTPEDISGNLLAAIIPLSLLGVLGLTVRRTR